LVPLAGLEKHPQGTDLTMKSTGSRRMMPTPIPTKIFGRGRGAIDPTRAAIMSSRPSWRPAPGGSYDLSPDIAAMGLRQQSRMAVGPVAW